MTTQHNTKKTCMNVTCPERTGGECTAGDTREWEESVKKCFLTERMIDWPIPTVRVNPDTLLFVVQSLLAKESKTMADAILMSKEGWIDQGRIEERKRITKLIDIK